MIKVGQKVRINPYKDIRLGGFNSANDIVDGVVHYVHPTHQWFNVEYDGGDGLQLLGFRFDDIGKNVRFVKE